MSNHDFREASLQYHQLPKPGKLEIRATTPLETKDDLAKAYSPGVAHACEAIVENNLNAALVTARGNLVSVISNGTAVLGLGNIGALASKPVMEGKVVLLKKFAHIDGFDIEIDETDPDKLIEIIAPLEPTFGGIILEDIKAPGCFTVEKKLRERMNIPVFHDDQHGTAVVSTAAVIAWLEISGKKMEDVKLVINGAGAASMACTDLIVSLGLKKQNLMMCDSKGLIYKGRTEGMNEYKEKYAVVSDKRTLAEALEGADIFFGLSQADCVTQDMLRGMSPDPLLLTMANPNPEIDPVLAREVWPNAVIGTGRSDYPNQVNNVLCFPFLFRGALDCGATTINEEMKLACAAALVDLAKKETTVEVSRAYAGETLKFGPDYIIPKPFDPRLIETIPVAVAKAAMETGVASRPIEDLEAYRRMLRRYVERSGMFMQPIVDVAKQKLQRIIYAEGEEDDVLHAVQSVVDQNIAQPILVGRPEIIENSINRLGLRLNLDRNIDIIDPSNYSDYQHYCDKYHQLVGRDGLSPRRCESIMRSESTAIAAMAVVTGAADGLICGKVGPYSHHITHITEIIGLQSAATHISSLSTLLLEDGPLFLADCFIDDNPTVEQVVKTTKSAIEMVSRFGITPRVALLSHSNFGTSPTPVAQKMREAAKRLREALPDVEIDGEMHAASALDTKYRQSIYKQSQLSDDANILIFPNMDAAHIALGLLRKKANGIMVGPFLSGFAKPAHVLLNSVTTRGIFNMSALTSADIIRHP